MSGNWISIDRRVWPRWRGQSDFYGNVYTSGVWTLLISWANWTDGSTLLSKQQVRLKTGQLVTSQKEVAEALGISRHRVRSAFAYLLSSQRISMAATRGGSLITILKYESYQGSQDGARPQSRHDSAHTPPTPRQPPAISKQGNKEQSNKKTVMANKDPDENCAKPRHLLDLWNECRGELDEVKRMTSRRRDKCATRLGEEPSLKEWREIFEMAASSAFAKGMNNRGWRMTFDWLIDNDHNYTKVAEGRYNDRKQCSSESEPLDQAERNQRLAAQAEQQLAKQGGYRDAL